jgi:hypothetical protein
MLASEPGAGKSALVLSALLAMNHSRVGWLGRGIDSKRPRRALFIGLDAPVDDYGYVLHRLANGMGIELGRTDDRLLFSNDRLPLQALVGQLNDIFPPDQYTEWIDGESEQFEADRPLEVLVIDALRQIHVGDENDSREMGLVMDTLRRISEAGVAVLFTHHVGKAAKDYSAIYTSRGSSVIAGSTDICINLLSADAGTGTKSVGLHVTKGRGHDFPKELYYRHTWDGDTMKLEAITLAERAVAETFNGISLLEELPDGAYKWSELLKRTHLSTIALKQAMQGAGWGRVGTLWQKLT